MQRGFLITEDKCRISYCHFCGGNPAAVIIAHGFYNSKEAVLLQGLAFRLKKRYDVIMFDFRGHGRSGGWFNWMSREGHDLRAVLDYAAKSYKRIGVIAFSMGAGIAVNELAKRKSADCLICVSPVADWRKLDYRLWRIDWRNDLVYTLFSRKGRKGKGIRPGIFWLKKKNPIDSVISLQTPVLYIHGDRDWVVLPRHSQLLHECTNCKKRIVIVSGGPHAEYMLKDNSSQILPEIDIWLLQHLS